jgi:hypothetical protein
MQPNTQAASRPSNPNPAAAASKVPTQGNVNRKERIMRRTWTTVTLGAAASLAAAIVLLSFIGHANARMAAASQGGFGLAQPMPIAACTLDPIVVTVKRADAHRHMAETHGHAAGV